MRYVLAKLEEYEREKAYRVYISESLRLQAENKYISKPFSEILEAFDRPVDRRTAEEIIEDSLVKLKITVL